MAEILLLPAPKIKRPPPGGKIYCAFIDASKAFDKVLHNGLFIKLLKRNAGLLILKYCQYCNSYCNTFSVLAVILQYFTKPVLILVLQYF